MRFSKVILFFLTSLLCFTNTQCLEDDDLNLPESLCDFPSLIDPLLYNSLESSPFILISAEIIEDCLMVELSASGCDGSSWAYRLVDSGAVAESSPEQRFLKFEFINTEVCLAVFEDGVSFDLEPLQVLGSHEIILNIEGLEGPFNYIY